jgi:hypothetical protein
MKKQEINIAKCGDCNRYHGGDEGFDCSKLIENQINNPRVDKESRACCDIEQVKQDKVKKILGGLIKINY